MIIEWTCKKFNELSPYEIYDVLRLRSEVFVVEQNCIFLDMDNADQQCFHLIGRLGDEVAAYTRLVPPGVFYMQPSIGRVVTAKKFRGHTFGYELMEESIKRCRDLFGNYDIKIGAQLYLKKFYSSFGFNQISDTYLEDGIEHIYMLLDAEK